MTSFPGVNAPSWSSMPMPQGWEAKYDSNAGKYFFINHQTRSTQWVDPRQTLYEAQQRSPRMPAQAKPQHIPMVPLTKPKCRTCKVNDVDSAGLTCQACQIQQQQREISLMRAREQQEEAKKRQEQQEEAKKRQEQRAKMLKERDRLRAQSANRQQQQAETSFNDQSASRSTELSLMDKIKLQNDLCRMFPSIAGSVVKIVLESCEWKRETAIEALLSMGIGTRTTPKDTPASSVWAAAKSSPAKAAAKKPQTKPAALSEAQKNEMKAKFKKQYPNATDSSVLLALESTNYNMLKAVAVMKMIKESEVSGAGTSSKHSAMSWTVTFPETATTVTMSQSSAKTVALSSSATVASSSSATVASSSSATVASLGTPQSSAVSKQMAPKKSTEKSTKKSQDRSKSSAPVGAPWTSSFSDHHTGAKGPDPSLEKGPDLNNLLDNYVIETGIDNSLYKGPDTQNIVGPAEKTGTDNTTVTGPDPSNLMGPHSGLANGSMHHTTRQC